MKPTAALRSIDAVALIGVRPRRGRVRDVAAVISDSARGGRIWFAASALAATSPRFRLAARDGMAGWGAASAAAFVLKAVTDRRRPALTGAGATPRSSSMPSSHTAGAVGYAVAAGLRSPASAVVLVPVAAAVGWSRAATARHFPTDVAAGAALGLLAGLAVHRTTAGPHRRRIARAPRRARRQRRLDAINMSSCQRSRTMGPRGATVA